MKKVFTSILSDLDFSPLKIFFIALIVQFNVFSISAAQTLSPGDLAIVGFNSTGIDGFSIVLLTDVTAGTVINFTDKGWSNAANNFVTLEGQLTWTTPGMTLPAGTIVVIQAGSQATPAFAVFSPDSDCGNNCGILTGFMLEFEPSNGSSGGDQLFVFQGTGAPASPYNHIAALNMAGQWSNGNIKIGDFSKSNLPTALEGTPFACIVNPQVNNALYGGSLDPADLVTEYCDVTNPNKSPWIRSDDAPFTNLNPRTALPIELSFFKATLKKDNVVLEWQTLSENKNDYMAIERSADAVKFTEIGRVAGAGDSYIARNYSFIDEAPLPGINYYRLRQVDFDGQYANSKIVSVLVGYGEGELVVFPTVTNQSLQVHFGASLRGNGQLRIFDLTGRLLYNESVGAGAEATSLDVPNWPAGTYLLQLQDDTGLRTARFVKAE